MDNDFDYERAFSRNIGWLTESEQQFIKGKRVAIAGMGGVGGAHLITLTRLGIGAFTLSDFDTFDIENFNRQAGASLSSVGQPKLDTMISRALDINPNLDIRTFPKGVFSDNVEAFLEGVDVYVDGLDFFALDARKAVFSACHRLGIPVTTAAPLGIGTAVLNFIPGNMTFEQYFRFEGASEEEQYLRFFVGLAPARLQSNYLVDPARIDVFAKKGPSTIMGCELCAGAAASQVLKMLLKRGKIVAAPWGLQFDAYNNRLAKTWRPGGNSNPLQRLAIYIGKRQLLRQRQPEKPAAIPFHPTTPAEKVLDLARWAPSGDNTQPWRFELIDDCRFVVHGSDTRGSVVYDLDGHASQLAIGGLLESIEIAASSLGFKADGLQRQNLPEQTPCFDFNLSPTDATTASPLAPYLKVRSVQRRAMSTRSLTLAERSQLEQSLPEGYRIRWFEGRSGRWQAAKLMFTNAKVRLTMPEAFSVHSNIVAWGQQFSDDRIPEQAIGVDQFTAKLMRWTLQSWERVKFMNRYCLGTLPPRLQLDLIPGLCCAAHFAIVAPQSLQAVEDYLQGGRAMQRFWLTAAKLGLGLQPEMTPLIFARYLRNGHAFTQEPSVERLARDSQVQFNRLMDGDAEAAVFIGRIGDSPLPPARSLRRDLEQLLINNESQQHPAKGSKQNEPA